MADIYIYVYIFISYRDVQRVKIRFYKNLPQKQEKGRKLKR